MNITVSFLGGFMLNAGQELIPDPELRREYSQAINRTGVNSTLLYARDQIIRLLNMAPEEVEQNLSSRYTELV